MTRNQMDVGLVQRICLNDPEAMDFLANYWARYCHEIDDIIDGDRTGPENILATFALAIELYSHPFYLKNLEALRMVARSVTSVYADTVAWEKSDVPWQREWADHHRHCSNEMVLAIAMICGGRTGGGGYEHARSIMPEMRATAFHEHHDREGKAV